MYTSSLENQLGVIDFINCPKIVKKLLISNFIYDSKNNNLINNCGSYLRENDWIFTDECYLPERYMNICNDTIKFFICTMKGLYNDTNNVSINIDNTGLNFITFKNSIHSCISYDIYNNRLLVFDDLIKYSKIKEISKIVIFIVKIKTNKLINW